MLGPYIYECLLDIAYGDKGYYINYSGRGREDVLWQLSEYVAGRYAVPVETIANVIDRLVECELFSDGLYKRGFITSKRMQMSYFIATLGRSGVQINFDIWLPTEEEMREKNPSGKSFVLQSFISWREKHITGQETDVSQPESTHSTEQDSTGENSIVQHSREQQSSAPASALADELEELLGCRFDKNFCLELARLQKLGMQQEVFLDAARQTNDKTPRSPAAYFRTVLQSCERDGILTAADLGATRAKPIEQSRLKQADDGGYLSPANLHGSSCEQENAPLADWEEAWLAQKAATRERMRQVEEQQDNSQLADWEIAWREQVMERRKQRKAAEENSGVEVNEE